MYTIGIDLGGTYISGGIVDRENKIVCKLSIPTGARRSPGEIVSDMAGLCARLSDTAGIDFENISYVGIASPGAVDPEKGAILRAENIPFKNYPICSALSEKLPVKKPVYIENDANAAALAEYFSGGAKGAPYSILITLGTGLGGGVIMNGKIYSGFNFAGAEFGHMVISKGGERCTCGRYGCWEAYSSATGLKRMTKEKILEYRKSGKSTMMEKIIGGDIEKVSGKTAFQAHRCGDTAAIEVIEEYTDYLSLGIANIINIFQPNVLAIGGGISNEGDYLLNLLQDKVFSQVFTKGDMPQCALTIAQLRNDAGIIGAAMLGKQ